MRASPRRSARSGLVGLAAPGFPTHVKLMPKNLDEVTTLLVNGAECEPYITADNRTMLEETDDIVEGYQAGQAVHGAL